jgi:hypothetical protein
MAASNLPESCAFLTRSIMDFMQPHLVWRIATRDDDSIEAVGSNLVGISIGFDLGYTSLASVTLLRATANHHHPGPRRLHGSVSSASSKSCSARIGIRIPSSTD